MTETLTLENLPTIVNQLVIKLENIERLLLHNNLNPIEQPEQLLTIQEAAEFLSLRGPTMYSKVSKGELPVMKRSKRLYFSRTELLDYLKDGRKKSNAEIEQEAKAYFLTTKKGLNNG